jgi:hypothetical protein
MTRLDSNHDKTFTSKWLGAGFERLEIGGPLHPDKACLGVGEFGNINWRKEYGSSRRTVQGSTAFGGGIPLGEGGIWDVRRSISTF